MLRGMRSAPGGLSPSHARRRRTAALWRLGALALAGFGIASACAEEGAPPGGTSAPVDEPAEPLAGGVLFSVPSGTFTTPFGVELSTAGSDGEIRYTLDGTAPTPTSPRYDGSALTITETTRLIAAVFAAGSAKGEPSTVLYVRRTGDVIADLPVIVLDGFGQGPPTEEDYDSAAFLVYEPLGGTTSLTQSPTVAAQAAYRVRGQTSTEFDKKNYRLELRDETGEDADYPLLGMPAQSDWVLHGPFADKSLLRNALAYGLGRDMGLIAPRFAFAELYLNTDGSAVDADDYVGVYLLVETVKNCRERLDLAQLDTTDTALPAISGGYVFKFELDVAEEPILPCTAPRGSPCWTDLEVYDPSPLNPEQREWLRAHLQRFHDVLFGADYADPVDGYASFIEVASFVDYMILQEVLRNLDAYIRSFYLHRDRDGKIVAGPLWDYNLIAGAGCCGSTPVEGFQHAIARNGDANGWLQRMVTDPAFAAQLGARYAELRGNLLADAQLDARIDALAAPLAAAAARNFTRWPNLTQDTIVYFETPTAPTWEGQIDALKSWLHQRLAWLDPRL